MRVCSAAIQVSMRIANVTVHQAICNKIGREEKATLSVMVNVVNYVYGPRVNVYSIP